MVVALTLPPIIYILLFCFVLKMGLVICLCATDKCSSKESKCNDVEMADKDGPNVKKKLMQLAFNCQSGIHDLRKS